MMTNSEAIRYLKTWRITGDRSHEALDMAISALQAQEAKTQHSAESTTPKVKKTCITCKHYPPESKWPCIDCDMSADRWEPQELSKNSPELDKENGELHPTCTWSCTGSEELKQEVKNSNESSLTQKALDTISRQAAIEALAKFVPYAICDESTESYTNGLTDAYNLICQLPSAQPEIIRCKDCKYRGGLSGFYCDIVEKVVGVDSFCSWAERRTDEGD